MLMLIISLVRRWKRFDDSVRELSRLSDRELADVGIKRSEISNAAWAAARR
jgi:uncharacterized protein YjiS (DUF1127 family)